MSYDRKSDIIASLQQALKEAGYEATKQSMSSAYPKADGSHALWGIWRSSSLTIHQKAQRLKRKGVVFTSEPEHAEETIPPPTDEEIPVRHYWIPRLSPADLQLPTGDRD